MADPVERRANLGTLGFEGRDLGQQRIALPLGDCAKRSQFVAAHLEPGIEIVALAAGIQKKSGHFGIARRQLRREFVTLAFRGKPKLLELFAGPLRRRLQRLALAIELVAKLGQSCFRHLRLRREFVLRTLQIVTKRGEFGFPSLQGRRQRIAFAQGRGYDVEVPVDVMLQRFAFRFQQIDMLGDGFVFVPPDLLFVLRRGQPHRHGFEQNGRVVQIVGIVSDRHHAGKAPQKIRGFRDTGGLGRHGCIRHEACFPKAPIARALCRDETNGPSGLSRPNRRPDGREPYRWARVAAGCPDGRRRK